MPDEWIPAAGLQLEPNAERAVRATRSVALTAGPGAGKTEMLAQRADFLFRTASCPYPRRILAISFKVDAAHNLRDRVQSRCGYNYASRLDSHTFHAFAKRLIDRFRPVLTGSDAIEPGYEVGNRRIRGSQIHFDDLVSLALKIVQDSPAARSALTQTYSHVFLDEFQDCTQQQYDLVRAAFLDSGTLVTAVGDTKQRIMGWAGALEGIFEKLATDFNAVPLNLYQNFRSQPRLRRMQNLMIKVMDPVAASEPAELEGEGGLVEVLRFEHEMAEAEYVAQYIQERLAEGVRHSEIAVLVSKQPHLYAASLMAKLTQRGVPCRNEQTLQDRAVEPVTQILHDLLQVIVGEREPEAFERLMSMTTRNLVDEDAAYARRARAYRYVAASRSRLVDGSTDLRNASHLRVTVFGFLKLLGRDAVTALSADYERGGRLDQVISDSLDCIEEQMAVDGDLGAALRRLSEATAVRILTIHKSKGLEFEHVILLGVERESFFGKDDEERSAFFVGISRAKSNLILTTANERPWPEAPVTRWSVARSPQEDFLSYAAEA